MLRRGEGAGGATLGPLALWHPFAAGTVGTASAFREVHTLFTAVEHWRHQLRGRLVFALVDATAVVYGVNKGAMKGTCGRVVAALYALCDEYDIRLLVCWQPREGAQVVDGLSKCAT